MNNNNNSMEHKSSKSERKSRTTDSCTNTPYASPQLIGINEDQSKFSNDDTFKLNNNFEQQISNSEMLDKIILNLKIISKLKPGYKLSINENSTIYIDSSYIQYIYRIFSDNSRQVTINFLENLDIDITNCIENLIKEDKEMFLNSKENILLNISHNLNLSLIGLNNLINTYSDDELTISKIEIIINSFELKIRKISSILKLQ